jgi:hypothetical protein
MTFTTFSLSIPLEAGAAPPPVLEEGWAFAIEVNNSRRQIARHTNIEVCSNLYVLGGAGGALLKEVP